MSVSLAPLSPRAVSVGPAEDPYKKYWWAILAGFAITGVWLCLPMMETSTGSTHIDTSKHATDANAIEQSLDAVTNPSGAPGGVIDPSLAKVAAKEKGAVDEYASMLYQSGAPEAAAAGAPVGASASAASTTLAQELKNAGKSNGWAEKAQRGFEAPHLSGGGLSGTGAASGGFSATAGGNSAFGSHAAEVTFGATQGLHDDGVGGPKKGAGGIQALRSAAMSANAAAAQRSGDAAVGGLSKTFDGAEKAQAISGGGPGGGAYAALDAAPVNLKLNNPELNKKEFKVPPSKPAMDQGGDGGPSLAKQLGMLFVTTLIGGMMPGMAGTMFTSGAMLIMQQQEAKAAQERAMERQRQVANR